MKSVKKKRSGWQDLLRVLRNNTGYRRVLNVREIHRKRVLREYIEMDYRANKKYYDREFEREWRKELREMNRPKKNSFVYLPPGNIGG